MDIYIGLYTHQETYSIRSVVLVHSGQACTVTDPCLTRGLTVRSQLKGIG